MKFGWAELVNSFEIRASVSLLQRNVSIIPQMVETLKGILSCWGNFSYVKTGNLVIPNQFLIFPNSTSNPPKFPKKLLFSCEKFHSNGIYGSTFSTQLVSTTPKSESNWRQLLQNLDQISVNDSKIGTKLVSTAPNIYRTWS